MGSVPEGKRWVINGKVILKYPAVWVCKGGRSYPWNKTKRLSSTSPLLMSLFILNRNELTIKSTIQNSMLQAEKTYKVRTRRPPKIEIREIID